MFALVCLFNVPLSEQGQAQVRSGIQAVLDSVIKRNGTYYLPYIAYPRLDQFRAAYPKQAEFFQKKQQYDPDNFFTNYFYMDYKGE